MKRTKIVFSIFVVGIIMLLAVEPVLALDIYDTETTVTAYRLQYSDDSYGNVNTTYTGNVFDNWTTYWNNSGVYNESIGNGVRMGAIYESHAVVNTTTGTSVTESVAFYGRNTTYGSDTYEYWTGAYAPYDVYYVPIIQFYVNISNRDIMNGAQEIWYRSPVYYDDTLYESHALNIYDSDGTLVCAEFPKFQYENRSYFKLTFKILSDERYRFKEGLAIVDDNPINTVQLYFANYQDIGSDGETDSYVFPGVSQARKFDDMEFSWSMIFVVGIGLAGTEKLLRLDDIRDVDSDYTWEIATQDLNGALNDVDYINVTIPFRCTERTTIRIGLFTFSGGSTSYPMGTQAYRYIENITGTIHATLPVNDPDAGEPNTYRIVLRIVNITEDDAWCAYTMYPQEGVYHTINSVEEVGGDRELVAVNHFAMYVEIEEGTTVEPYSEACIRWDTVLIGTAVLIAGIFVTSFAILTGNIPLILVGAGLIVGGAYTVYEGVIGLEPGTSTLGTIYQGVSDGVVQLGKTIYDGFSWVAENAWNAILYVVEALQIFGSGLMFVFETLADLSFFLFALLVLWVYAKFLKIMTGVVKGDIDGALATTQTVVNKPATYVKRKVRTAKSAYRTGKKIRRKLRR